VTMIVKPETIYKYERLSVLSLQNLKKSCVYFASPSQFNDPYDCTISATIDEPTDDEIETLRTHYLSKPDLSENARKELGTLDPATLRQQLVRGSKAGVEMTVTRFLAQKGVTCFAERKDDLLMWSHYGGSYQGFCLEFRTSFEPFSKVRPVKYVESRPRINLCEFVTGQSQEIVDHLYCTKSAAWAYEREWRLLHHNAGTLYCYEADALKAIYFGPNMDSQTKEILCLILAGQNPNVEFWHVNRVIDRFELTFEKFNYTSHNEAKRLGLAQQEIPIEAEGGNC
jgi:hypothetical protein